MSYDLSFLRRTAPAQSNMTDTDRASDIVLPLSTTYIVKYWSCIQPRLSLRQIWNMTPDNMEPDMNEVDVTNQSHQKTKNRSINKTIFCYIKFD